jgi:hypothetical protein
VFDVNLDSVSKENKMEETELKDQEIKPTNLVEDTDCSSR